jgi:hypothetical protein
MITGVRLTQLANGEPLLGTSWSYKGVYGVEAAERKLDDLFFMAKYLGFNYIIDTINPQFDSKGQLTLEHNGCYGDTWTLERRLELYQQYTRKTDMQIFLEVDFPCNVTEENYMQFANYFLDLVGTYYWVKHWQVMVTPEQKDQFGNYKCDPIVYCKFMKYVAPKAKILYDGVRIGGPGVFQGLVDYYKGDENCWLHTALGNKYGVDSKYEEIGPEGFLKSIDFFTIQGKQNTEGLNYTFFPQIIDQLNIAINSKLNKGLTIISINQGWQSFETNPISLQQQSYYEIREILNGMKRNVIPFKNQLIDEFNENTPRSIVDTNKLGYGLLYYYGGAEAQKPACDEYHFILKTLEDYNEVTDLNYVSEPNSNIDSVTLKHKDQNMTATILWPKNPTLESVVLKAHYNRHYLTYNGEPSVISEPKQIFFQDHYFLIVFEKLQDFAADIVELENSITKKLQYSQNTLQQFISLLPNSYNKEIRDTNYYKLLRSVALELSDAKINIEELQDNVYLDSVHNDYIYKNFGVLVNLKKRPEWDNSKYRRLVKGVMKSLLEGPTSKSITQAIQLFTNFDVNIHELYKETNTIDPSLLAGVNPQYAFVVEIEKPLEEYAEQESIYRDTNYIINIIKPAHTISIVVITLQGKEDYRKGYAAKYGKEFENSDESIRYMENIVTEGIYGWKAANYSGVVDTSDANILSNNRMTNGGLFIGPRYVLQDNNNIFLDVTSTEKMKEVIDSIIWYLNKDVEDVYEGAEEEMGGEALFPFIEHKFGFDYNRLIQLNGGNGDDKEDLYEHERKVLNKYRLAYGSKLDDDVIFEYENFYQEKYLFRNTLRSFRFNKPNNVGHFNGFNSKFGPDIPDKAIQFHFGMKELSFKKKVIKLFDGTEKIIERLDDTSKEIQVDWARDFMKPAEEEGTSEPFFDWKEEDILQGKDTNQWIKLSSDSSILNSHKLYTNKRFEQLLIELILPTEYFKPAEEEERSHVEIFKDDEFKDAKEEYETLLDFLEDTDVFNPNAEYETLLAYYESQFKDAQDDFLTPVAEFFPVEHYRPIWLSDEIYHDHRKVIKVAEHGYDPFLFKLHDLADKGTKDEESMTKVYVNGLLMPPWAYTEIPSPDNPEHAMGIRFVDEHYVYPGDIVNVLYLRTREIIIGDFPITEESPTDVIFGVKNEVYKVIERIDDELIVNYEYSAKFHKAMEYLCTIVAGVNEYETYEPKEESVAFEGSPYHDIVLWNKTKEQTNNFSLGDSSSLNTLPMLGAQQERTYEIGMDTYDEYEPKEDLLAHSDAILPTFNDIHDNQTIIQVIDFNGYKHEDNIVANLNIIDAVPEIGMMPHEHYIPKDDSGVITNATVNISEAKYIPKDDHEHFYLQSQIFVDKFPHVRLFDKYTEVEYEVYENFDKSTIEHIFNTIADLNYVETKYEVKEDHYSNWLITGIYDDRVNHNLLKDHADYGVEVGDNREKDFEDVPEGFIIDDTEHEDFDKSSIDHHISAIDTSPQEEIHTLQSNLFVAFKFGSSVNNAHKFNDSKFATKLLLDYEAYTCDVEDISNIEVFDHVTDIQSDTEEPQYKVKKVKILSEYNRDNSEKYEGKTDENYVKHADNYNREEYSLKGLTFQLEMFRIGKNNQKQVIKIFTSA